MHFPASLTKIANAIVAIENEPSSENLYVMGEELVDRMIMDDASMAGFFAGETLCFNDLLYGTMLPSGEKLLLPYLKWLLEVRQIM